MPVVGAVRSSASQLCVEDLDVARGRYLDEEPSGCFSEKGTQRRLNDVGPGEKAPRILRGASDPILWHTCGAVVERRTRKRHIRPNGLGDFSNPLQRAIVELGGFEPPTSSLRKMQSTPSDQGF